VDKLRVQREAALGAELREMEHAAESSQRLVVAMLVLALTSAAVVLLYLVRLLRRQRAAQAAANLYLTRIEQANDDLDAFAGRVAHDIRNFLTPLGLLAELVSRGAQKSDRPLEDPQLLARLAKLGEAVKAGDEIVSGLLAFSRAGHAAHGPRSASVRLALERTVTQLRPPHRRRAQGTERGRVRARPGNVLSSGAPAGQRRAG